MRDECESFAFVWDRPGERTLGHRVANEAVLAEVMSAVRQTLGTEVRATAVHFRHRPPSSTKAHEAYFGTRVAWEHEEDAIVLPRVLLSTRPRFANLAMSSYFESEAARRLTSARQADSLREAVARIVAEQLMEGEPPLEAVAKQLGKSERTLRRTLTEEGCSYRLVLDGVRRERANELLANSAVSLTKVAFALGFSELGGFSRAYKRWTGVSPIEARRRM
jgi:AraC-like DNA-binding protein